MIEDIMIVIGVFVVTPVLCGLLAKFIIWLIAEDNLRAAKARELFNGSTVDVAGPERKDRGTGKKVSKLL
jgi:hypothetical protein